MKFHLAPLSLTLSDLERSIQVTQVFNGLYTEVLTRVMRLGLESDSSHYFCDLTWTCKEMTCDLTWTCKEMTCDLTWPCKEMTCYQRKSKATRATQGPHKFLK